MMMKSLSILGLATLFCSVTMMATGFPDAKSGQETFKVNNAVGKNNIIFLSDAPLEKIKGTADEVSGEFKMDPVQLEATTGRIVVNVDAMSTAISKRDQHMRSEDWLGAEKYPTIVFDIKSLSNIVAENRDGRRMAVAKAHGTFTLHGVTKPLTADVTLTYLPESNDTKKRASGDFVSIKANFTVTLKDYNVVGRAGLVGSKVGEVITVEANLFANS